MWTWNNHCKLTNIETCYAFLRRLPATCSTRQTSFLTIACRTHASKFLLPVAFCVLLSKSFTTFFLTMLSGVQQHLPKLGFKKVRFTAKKYGISFCNHVPFVCFLHCINQFVFVGVLLPIFLYFFLVNVRACLYIKNVWESLRTFFFYH